MCYGEEVSLREQQKGILYKQVKDDGDISGRSGGRDKGV